MLPEHVDSVDYLDWENASHMLPAALPAAALRCLETEVYWAPSQGADNSDGFSFSGRRHQSSSDEEKRFPASNYSSSELPLKILLAALLDMEEKPLGDGAFC